MEVREKLHSALGVVITDKSNSVGPRGTHFLRADFSWAHRVTPSLLSYDGENVSANMDEGPVEKMLLWCRYRSDKWVSSTISFHPPKFTSSLFFWKHSTPVLLTLRDPTLSATPGSRKARNLSLSVTICSICLCLYTYATPTCNILVGKFLYVIVPPPFSSFPKTFVYKMTSLAFLLLTEQVMPGLAGQHFRSVALTYILYLSIILMLFARYSSFQIILFNYRETQV